MRKHTIGFLVGAALTALPVVASAAAGDTLAAGDPANLFDLTDYVSTDTSLITAIRFLPDGRMLIAQKVGALKIRENDGSIRQLYSFPVTTTSEQGFIGLAVQPDFATSRRIIVYWTRTDAAGGSVENRINVSSFRLNDADDTVDPASERVLIRDITAPANHDGGGLSFGSDGFLYVGVGDNGCNENIPATRLHRNLRSTSFNVANGKILRVALDGAIPPSNPWVATTGSVSGKPFSSGVCEVVNGVTTMPTTTEPVRKDIFAMGFRNPFRIWTDPKTNFVWVGDVGETSFEEIDVVTRPGQHFGWPFIEGEVAGGAGPWTAAKCTELTPNPGGCVEPAHAYGHLPANANGSVTGGRIVDSCRFPPAWRGKYFFADYLSREVYSMGVTPGRDGLVAGSREVFLTLDGAAGQGPTDMLEGPDGALYVVLYASAPTVSRVVRVYPKTPAPASDCVVPGADAGADGGVDAGPDGGRLDGGSDGGVVDSGAGADGGCCDGGSGPGPLADAGGADAGQAAAKDTSGCGCETVGAPALGARAAVAAFGLGALFSAAVVRRRRRR
ncbi:MAG TPA: PQQ-dependent sugar dehydrogenase [Polyangiaceae bacterium]|nr:PQQ-dependent sugar dehydrogenase [Polyangiaceae bacterium]